MTGKKKILLVSSAFYPEISPRSFRATELAKEFYRQGHDVTVITKFRAHDYTEFLKEFPITFKMWENPVFPKVPVFRQKYLSYISRWLARVLSILFEYPGIEEMFKLRLKLRNEEGYNLMISFAVPYPVHWGVAWSRTLKHRIAETWIADCGDPYMGDVLDSFRKPFYFRYLEKSFCRKADFITIPVETAMRGYYQEFHHKIKIIPQGFDFDLQRKSEQAISEFPSFAYAGGFLAGARDPKPLLNFLKKLDTPFRFYVYTNMPDFINEFKLDFGEKLIISGYIPRNELMSVLSEMNFLINFDNNTKLNSPSKLIDYSIVEKPVLNIVRNFNEDDVLAFLQGDYRNKMLLPDPEQYHIKNISQQFLDL
jgi:hypothetical protein